jgi:hypothetical protein
MLLPEGTAGNCSASGRLTMCGEVSGLPTVVWYRVYFGVLNAENKDMFRNGHKGMTETKLFPVSKQMHPFAHDNLLTLPRFRYELQKHGTRVEATETRTHKGRFPRFARLLS